MWLTEFLVFYIGIGSFSPSIFIESLNFYRTNDSDDDICVWSSFQSEYAENSVPFDQTTFYCIRDAEVLRILTEDPYYDPSNRIWTFSELEAMNITSDDLLEMSASVDQVELYQMYLDGFSSIQMQNNTFINCSNPWFSIDCRFKMDPALHNLSFDMILAHLWSKQRRSKNFLTACYMHLQCEKTAKCLDWREICDNKIDCADGSDEVDCWMLEINECSPNEFRCRNGQCIPKEFFEDNAEKPDCLDGSDEKNVQSDIEQCWSNRALGCENIQCRGILANYLCEEEYCTVAGSLTCTRGPNSFLPGNLCWIALSCLLNLPLIRTNSTLINYCKDNDPMGIKRKACPSWIQFPPVPVLFDHIRFVFTNETTNYTRGTTIIPDYICFDIERCSNITLNVVRFENLTCAHHTNFNLTKAFLYEDLVYDVKSQLLGCSDILYEGNHCNHRNMYRCQYSRKCISKYRLMDGVQDCLWNDDENMVAEDLAPYSLPEKRPLFSPTTLAESYTHTFQENRFNFAELCDGIHHLSPVHIDGTNETDETNCHDWPCNRSYTRCDRHWYCKNGADESNCDEAICPPHHHPCVFFNQTKNISCLPINQAGNGVIDCLGGSDEPQFCETWNQTNTIPWCFTCRETNRCLSYIEVCNKKSDCPLKDDELFCQYGRVTVSTSPYYSWATTDVEIFIEEKLSRSIERSKHFRLGNVRARIPQIIVNLSSKANTSALQKLSHGTTIRRMISLENVSFSCNQGVPIYFRLNNQTTNSACLCPPTHYGSYCQYQNQRVSLTIKINAIWKWTNIFVLIITLIDEEYNIESYAQIEHLTVAGCVREYYRDIIYSSRPKNNSKLYSIRIDVFDKLSGQYQTSWIFPIFFSFLPVYRLPVLLQLHQSVMKHSSDCSPSCIHGQCLRYYNAHHISFCRCDTGWSGIRCNRPIQCQCAFDAYCYSRSICICPMNRYGPRCYLKARPLEKKYCLNGGKEIFLEKYHLTHSEKNIFCLCSKEFFGNLCQYHQSLIQIRFHQSISIPSFVWIHWIRSLTTQRFKRWSQLSKIPVNEETLSLYMMDNFHFAFAQISNHYYLIISRQQTYFPVKIETQIHPSYRCLSIDEIFNRTIYNLHPLKRIKYYQNPCRQNPTLACFYDHMHLCLCEQDETSNCFPFDHNMKFDCQEKDFCMNNGQCMIEQSRTCPRWAICICRDCYFGSRCQFSTEETLLPLGTILGYHLKAGLSVAEQSKVIKMSIAYVTTVLVIGFLNNIASLWAFQSRTVLALDGGRYLLAATITSLVLITFLIVHFWLYTVWQLGFITDRSFFSRQCTLMNFILRLLISSIDWFFALAAIERMFTVIRGVYFDKMKGRRIAKRMIILIFLVTSLTYLHDPLYRKIVTDEREGRTWCISIHSENLRRYDRTIVMIHFFIPFIIDLISPLIILIWIIHRQWNMRRCMPLKEMIKIQYRIHRHRLLSPSFLCIINVCRIFFTLFASCLKMGRDPWSHIFGYFLSFAPASLSFIIFVLPSSSYRKEMIRSIKNCCKD